MVLKKIYHIMMICILDIIHCPADNNFTVIVDEDELLKALNTGKITREESILQTRFVLNCLKNSGK